ncbi:MAG: virginiamycin B lyase family protein, partial [Candidatus Nanopelagicales bacterium]
YGSVQLATASDPTGITNVDGAIWFAMSARNQLGKLVADTTVLEMSVPGAPTGLANGVGNTMWVSLTARNSVAKYSAQGAPLGEYTLTSPNSGPTALSEGPDSNVWVAQTTAGKVARVLSGAVPVSTGAPTVTPNTGVRAGTTLTASEGTWSLSPGSYLYQWQACTNGADANTCTNIAGATAQTYVPTATQTNQFVRVGVQGVNGSGPGNPAYSALVGVGVTPPPTPSPVAGDGVVTIAPGITLTLNTPTAARAGRKATYSVVANTANIKGKVRLSIVDSAGRERQVIAKGRWLKPAGTDAKQALKRKRVLRSLPAGTYTVKAVFTPTPAFRDNYPVATISKVMTIRR